MNSNQPTRRSKSSWRKRVGCVGIVFASCLVGFLVTWLAAKSYIRSSIESQLAELELGKVTIGSVSILSNGVQASNVTLSQDGAPINSRIQLDELIIRHPLLELIAGATRYQSLELNGLSKQIDLDELLAKNTEPTQLDLSDLELPADEIRIQNSQLTLTSKRKPDLVVSGIQAVLNIKNQVEISGSIDNLLNSQWELQGTASPLRNEFQIELSSESIELQSKRWQEWPGIPDDLNQAFEADGTVSLQVNVNRSEKNDYQVQAKIDVEELLVDFPDFEIPLQFSSGEFRYIDDQIAFADVQAKMPLGGTLTATKGSVVFDNFPIRVRASGNYQQIPIATWRKFSPEIPPILQGISDGDFETEISVSEEATTTITVNASAQSENSRYGKIDFANLRTLVAIDQLNLDEKLKATSILGSIKANARVSGLPVIHVFETFELNELEHQLELSGRATGTVAATLPLNTIEDLKTWRLDIDSMVQEGQIAGLSLDSTHVPVILRNGELIFENILANLPTDFAAEESAVPPRPRQFSLDIQWPLIDGTSLREFGHINVTGTNVHPIWLKQFTTHQLSRSLDSETPDFEFTENVFGSTNFQASLKLLAAQPNSLENWHADAVIKNSSIGFEQTELRNVRASIAFKNSEFIIDEVQGKFQEGHQVEGQARWDLAKATGEGTLRWEQVPIDWLAALAGQTDLDLQGNTSGQVEIRPAKGDSAQDNSLPVSIVGSAFLDKVTIEQTELAPFEFDIRTRDELIFFDNLRSPTGGLDIDANANVAWNQNLDFQINGQLDSLRLSKVLSKPFESENLGFPELTGTISGEFGLSGQLNPFRWQTEGEVAIRNPTIDLQQLDDIQVTWEHVDRDWQQTKVSARALGGQIELTELTRAPEQIQVELSRIDAEELNRLLKFPVALSGLLDGDATLNDWSLEDTRRAEINLSGSSLLIGQGEYGDFQASVDFAQNRLSYKVSGSVIDGKFEGNGETLIAQTAFSDTEYPLELRIDNGSLNSLYSKSNYLSSLRPLAGRLQAALDLVYSQRNGLSGTGRVSINEVKWNQKLLSREASARVALSEDRVAINDVRVDLKRGSIAARASIPLSGSLGGTYEIDIRKLDLHQLMRLMDLESLEAQGQVDLRVNGQIGQSIVGRGYLGFERASFHDVAGQSVRVPIQYRLSTCDMSGRLQFRRSKFRLFAGSVSGDAQIDFGRRTDLNLDLDFTGVNSGDLLASVANLDDFDQGRLSGHLRLRGKGIRSARDLKGDFQGSLDRVAAFQLPVIENISRFVSGQNLANREFDSDSIQLTLNRGRIDVNQLNFESSLAQIAIEGSAFVDGRLDLSVAGRVEQINQPPLIDELLGSPLANFAGSPTAFFAQAADFLADRIVFLRIGGTFDRPQVRIDSPQQLRQETIRYFLRDSNILPIRNGRNN